MSGGKAGDGVGTGDSIRHASPLQKQNQEAKKLAALEGEFHVVFRKIQAAYEEQFRNQDAKQLAAVKRDIDVALRKMQADNEEQINFAKTEGQINIAKTLDGPFEFFFVCGVVWCVVCLMLGVFVLCYII